MASLAWQNTDGDARLQATVARSSSAQRLPGLPRSVSAATITGLVTTQTRDNVGDGRSYTERLRDHWSQSSYSPGQCHSNHAINSIMFAQFINDISCRKNSVSSSKAFTLEGHITRDTAVCNVCLRRFKLRDATDQRKSWNCMERRILCCKSVVDSSPNHV